MPYFDVTEDKFKNVVVNDMFVGPADYNYIHARFCRAVGLHKEFSWQCLQALEKYFKAGLLVNNTSVKGFSHNLPRLLQAHRDVYGELSVTNPERPDNLNEDLWKQRSLDDLVEWIHFFGHPDSRYGLRPYRNDPSDLFLLDVFVFELRRRIGRLDAVIGTDLYANGEIHDATLEQCRGETFSHLLATYPGFQLFGMNVPDIKFADAGESMEDTLYSWNFPWARNPEDLQRPAPRTVNAQFGGFGNSTLFLLQESIRRNISSPDKRAVVRRRMEWMFSHIPLGRGVENELRQLITQQ